MFLDETFTLSNGVKIPKLGYGTWQIKSDIAKRCALEALEVGYRHIDSAIAYGNEEEIGKALKECGLKREEIFLTSKIPAQIKTYEEAKECIEGSLKRFDTPYIDLMLIHAPRPWQVMRISSRDYDEGNRAVWKALEEAYEAGKLRSIGVSNFDTLDIENILTEAKVIPMVNQIPLFISLPNQETLDYCHKKGILVEAYSPIATGRLLGDTEVGKLAEKYGVTIPQFCIRYTYQKGALPLPKTTHKEFMIENAKLDFEISEEDMNYLDTLKGKVAW